jgi:hypothetical protein
MLPLVPDKMFADLLKEVTGVGRKGLAKEVKEAQAAYAVSDIALACAELADFIGEVRERGGDDDEIAATVAQKLIEDANEIRLVIGCR